MPIADKECFRLWLLFHTVYEPGLQGPLGAGNVCLVKIARYFDALSRLLRRALGQ